MRRGKTERLTVLPSSARDRKHDDHDAHWPRVSLPHPFSTMRVPVPPRLYHFRLVRRSWAIRIAVLAVLVVGSFVLLKLLRARTLVFAAHDLQRVWEWEIASGHHPGVKPIPGGIGLQDPIPNPALGARRTYIAQTRPRSEPAIPLRPVPGSVLDLDLILDLCDFSANKYARDCLEVLRVGGGLDTLDGRASESVDAWKYTYVEQPGNTAIPTHIDTNITVNLKKKLGALEPPLSLSPPFSSARNISSAEPCDPAYPRLFHVFWAGPFTDKPYMALLSFLFTQNLGLDNITATASPIVCRPQFWAWIHTNETDASMAATLHDNPWSAPFLHPRFKDVIRFRKWNTTQQLDSIPELKNEWRRYKDDLLNSGGRRVKAASAGKKSTVLSDMARFVVTYRFGGVYLDADTLFLRDWEELWGWRGAFAYRWSWHEDWNTAVLRMHAGSALGSFLFRTALRNGLDFHPMTITSYLRDAGLDRLLFRIPDALFDPAFLTAEHLQLDRPPFPEFQYLGHFFGTPSTMSAAPQVVGFEGFFRGAYSYHWHNFWWQEFDPERNWPDLGQRFYDGEGRQRALLQAQEKSLKKTQPAVNTSAAGPVEAKHDVDWSAVLKRTFEAYIRGERPNMYGEWIVWPPDA